MRLLLKLILKVHFCCIFFSIFDLFYSLLHGLNYDDDRKTLNTSSRVLIKSSRYDACVNLDQFLALKTHLFPSIISNSGDINELAYNNES